MKIFVINLKSSTDRRREMEAQLERLALPYEIFDAVIGSEIKEEEILNYFDHQFYINRPSYYTAGAIGCTLSHYFIYQKIVAEKIELALILEDDMVLKGDLPMILNNLKDEIRDDEVIMLFYQSYFPINLAAQNAKQLDRNYKLYQVIELKGLRSTGGYLINYHCAKSMVKKLLPFDSLPDAWVRFYERNIINGVRVVHPFVLTNSYVPTTISPNNRGDEVVKKFISFCQEYKIFPVYHLLKLRRKKNIAKSQQCFFLNQVPIDFRIQNNVHE